MDENIQDFPESPFEPGHPVSPDKFKGRKKDINKISRYLPKVKNQGVPFHFFITGKRGMGKTSFVKYLANEIRSKLDKIKSEHYENILMKICKAKKFSFKKSDVKYLLSSEIEDYYFSVIDVIAVLTESKNPSQYWRTLKSRLKEEGGESVTNCNRLKMPAADGKLRLTDV